MRKKKTGGCGSPLDPDETPALLVCISMWDCGSVETDVGRLEPSVSLVCLRAFEFGNLSVKLTFVPFI